MAIVFYFFTDAIDHARVVPHYTSILNKGESTHRSRLIYLDDDRKFIKKGIHEMILNVYKTHMHTWFVFYRRRRGIISKNKLIGVYL